MNPGVKKQKRKIKSSTLRVITALAVVLLVCLGLAMHSGTGTPSAWGISSIAALCPLGGIEALIASKTFIPPVLIGVAIVLLVTVLVGRAFCAWGCPVPLLRRVFGGKKKPANKLDEGNVSAIQDVESSDDSLPAAPHKGVKDSRFWVLGGTVLTTAVFGFPVFCLVCPVGLTFGTLILAWRLFQFNEVTWSLLVFPAILILELVVLRKWCHRFCPLGALLSLVSRANRTLRPQANADLCLHTQHGEKCHQCSAACPEGIDLHNAQVSAPKNECLKCRECADACPVQAISFPFISKQKNK